MYIYEAPLPVAIELFRLADFVRPSVSSPSEDDLLYVDVLLRIGLMIGLRIVEFHSIALQGIVEKNPPLHPSSSSSPEADTRTLGHSDTCP